jgi:hypothetical protein
LGKGDAPTIAEAETHIRTALDSWIAGAPANLANQTPALRFVDPDEATGQRLGSYTLHIAEAKHTGPTVDLPVTLTTKNTRGVTKTKRVIYQVATQPTPAVLRNDPD